MKLLRCVAKGMVKAVGNYVGFGVGGDVLGEIWDYWVNGKSEEEKKADLQDVAAIPTHEILALAPAIVEEEASELNQEDKDQLANYVSQVPSIVRRTFQRPTDPSGTTVPHAISLTRSSDLARFLPPKLPRFRSGTELPGNWVLDELLGIGGFGEVWKAKHEWELLPPIAVKFCLDPEGQRFLKWEAGILAQVANQGKHPGFVSLLGTNLNLDPPSLLYEFIDGWGLGDLIQELHLQGGPSAPRANQVILRITEIVAFAHELEPSVVHRDLKPANILVQNKGANDYSFKITDFGIGGLATLQLKVNPQENSPWQWLHTNMMRGAHTHLYASPQQKQGMDPDPRDDVHALGVIWYQLLTGQMDIPQIPHNWADEVEERGLSETGRRLLKSCLAPKAEPRPANAIELACKLKELFVEDDSVSSNLEDGETNAMLSRIRQALSGKWLDSNQAVREAAGALGYQALHPAVRDRAQSLLQEAIRRGIVEIWENQVHGRVANDFGSAAILPAICALLPRGIVFSRETVVAATAHYLGFQNLTETIRQNVKNGITAGIKQGVLRTEGNVIWKEFDLFSGELDV